MDFDNIAQSAQGLSYLSGDIMPWDDYVIMRVDDDTSIAVYGNCIERKSNYVYFPECTVRTVTRATSSGYSTIYDTDEEVYNDVYCYIHYPYYAYGNVIGINYDLPSSDNIIASFLSAAVVVASVVFVFKSLWRLRQCLKR